MTENKTPYKTKTANHVKIILRWRDLHQDLSQNSRAHWSKRNRATSTARMQGRALAMEYLDTQPFTPHGRLIAVVNFYPPDKIKRDTQNYFGMLKAHFDGIFDALRTDDERIKTVILKWHEPVKPGARVEILIGLESEK